MKRKAFTLVELLIVIVVIGVLAAMMMLSSNEAVSSAKAAKIISDLRNLKTAVLAWYMDYLDAFYYNDQGDYANNVKLNYNNKNYHSVQDLLKDNKAAAKTVFNYLEGLGGLNGGDGVEKTGWIYIQPGRYGINDAGTGTARRSTWFVGYQFTDKDSAVKEKLWKKRNTTGLIFTTGVRPNEHNHTLVANQDSLSGVKTVWLHVLGDYVPDGVENNYKK